MSNDLHYGIGKAILIAHPENNGIREATLYPSLPYIDQLLLPCPSPEICLAVRHLRIDTVNSCNLSCVFCHSNFSAKVKHLDVEDFAEALLDKKFSNLKLITLGCAYEPLMGKNFEKFADSIQSLRNVIKANIVTNGLLFHKKDIAPWVEFGLQKIYVSVYSHIAEIYSRTARNGGKFEQIEMNLLDIRKNYPSLDIHIVTPICKTNDTNVTEFCDWVFEKNRGKVA